MKTQHTHALRIVQKYHPGVTSVCDAKRGVTFAVTKADASKGKSKEPDSCALARSACRRHDGAIISLAVAYIINGKKAVRYRVPSSISRELVSFDRAGIFAPGKYRLAAPSSNERLGSPARKRPPHAKKGGKVRRAHKTAVIRSLYEHHAP